MEAAGDTQGDNSCHGEQPGGGDGAGGWMAVTIDAKMEGRMKGYRGWRAGDIPCNLSHLLLPDLPTGLGPMVSTSRASALTPRHWHKYENRG